MWAAIAPVLPSTQGRRGGRYRDSRQVIEGIIWRFRTGSPWRDVPERYGPWQTVWKRHAAWSADGTWDRLVAAAQSAVDAAGNLEWQVGVDATIVRVHQHASGARRGGSVESQQLPAAARTGQPRAG